MNHFRPGDLIMIFIGSPESVPYIIHKLEKVSTIQSKHVSQYDILFYKPDGGIGRVDIVHTFHLQECDSERCINFLSWYMIKK